ncbi:Exocyst complex component 5 [Morus notabilis]|uniref:Exocyst complex component 5 n=1 Tax=Morus notabilis TaxID=981085 RepID=W9QPT0_9ROSA|nr:Exocyst complex component 5 [Morus notabilis]
MIESSYAGEYSVFTFNRGTSAMQHYVATCPMFIDLEVMNTDTRLVLVDHSSQATPSNVARGLASLYKEITDTVREEAATIMVVFPSPNEVMSNLVKANDLGLPKRMIRYVVVYFSILYLRYHAGIVTDEMLSMPKAPFLAVGLLEALAAATGMAAGGNDMTVKSMKPQVKNIDAIPVQLNEVLEPSVRSTLLVQLVCKDDFLDKIRMSGSGAGNSLKEAGIFWSLLMILSFLFQAADTVLKEVIFLDAARKLKGNSVDLFVVNSFGSAFQLPNYLKDGAACFLNIGTLSSGCDGAPLLPLLFVIVNMGFNISLLHLLKISSGVVSCLASTFSVPISVYLFTLPLPYLGVASSLPRGFVAGTIVLVMGLLIYAWTSSEGSSDTSPSESNLWS